MSYRFLIVLFAVLFGGFRWRRPKWMAKGRDWLNKRAEAARIRKEALERRRLEKQVSLELKRGK